jgi:integrase/recombinase XerD
MTPLRRRMIDDMQIRNLAPLTQTAYVQQVSLFARHFGQSPEHLGRDEIRAYQIHLVQDKHLAASSISVAVAALRFLYTVTLKRDWPVEEDIPTVRRPQKLPVVLSQAEVGQFLDAVRSLRACLAGVGANPRPASQNTLALDCGRPPFVRLRQRLFVGQSHMICAGLPATR